MKSRILELLHVRGVLRACELADQGITRATLRRMVADGILVNPERGLYVRADAEPNVHQSLIEATVRVPHGVICLLSALQFHGLTTQAPFEVWMAIAEKARYPTVCNPALRIVRFSETALKSLIEEHPIDGIVLKVYSPAKTVADCFKYRNKIGLDVALEALRDCWRLKKATMDEIYQAAVICRMTRVMRPYLESLV